MSNREQIETWYVRLSCDQFVPSRFTDLGETASYAQSEEAVWVKLSGPANVVRPQLMGLPGQRWIENGGKLFCDGQRVPVRPVPECDWITSLEWFHIELPRAAVARRFDDSQRRPLRLVRGGTEQPPWALLTTAGELESWVATAADAFLKPLTWAVDNSDASRCLVVGPALPPVRGQYFTNLERILLPAGYCWQPSVGADVIRHVFAVPDDAWLLWENDQSHTCIDDAAFVPLSRGSVRVQHDV